MDWIDVAKAVAPLAPTLGGLIGGLIPFPGAGLAGEALGGIIARQFGVDPTPDAVHGAITSNPNEVVLAKLSAALEEAKAQYPAIAQIEAAREKTQQTAIESVNATMRAELGHEHWFFSGWRPTAGWLFDIYAAIYGGMLAYAVSLSAFRDNHKPLEAMTAAWPLFAIFLGSLAAMVGVYVVARSQDKSNTMFAGGVIAPAPTALVPKPTASVRSAR